MKNRSKIYCPMRNLVQKHMILSFVLFSMTVTAFAQETDWEKEDLQGKVKKYELFSYDFDISDSINHDEFMRKFYQCEFDLDRIIRFADSVKKEKGRKECFDHVYDSLGYLVKILLSDGSEIKFQNEYDNQSRILRSRAFDNVSRDSVFFTYDDFGRILEEKQWSRELGYRSVQCIYDSEGRLLEENKLEGDTVYSYYRKRYDKHGVLRKSERFGFSGSDSKVYCEYDSKGNVVFERTENGPRDIVKEKTKYKYDKNDSIVKETCRKTRWYEMPVYKDEVWQLTDSTGRLIDYSDYVVEYNKYKTKSKSVRIISRDEKGVPVEEIYENKINEKDSEPRIVKTRYDEMGRVVEETRINCPYSGCFRKVFKYYNDSERLTYYATYNGDDEESVAFSHESLFFYDERGNCIAHIQWMPGNSSEYYFDVYRYEYYE